MGKDNNKTPSNDKSDSKRRIKQKNETATITLNWWVWKCTGDDSNEMESKKEKQSDKERERQRNTREETIYTYIRNSSAARLNRAGLAGLSV